MYDKVVKNRCFQILIVLLTAVAVLFAETPAYQLLGYSFSARTAAMGGTQAVDPSGYLDLQGNPAGSSFVKEVQTQVGFVNHLAGINGYAMAGVIPLERHRLSAELVYFDYGIFDKTDVNGVSSGTFGYHELASSLGYAFTFSEAIRLGGRVGHLQREADTRSQGDFYYDLGAVYHKPLDSLSVGVYLASAALGNPEEILPTRLVFGTSKILSHLPLRLNLDGSYGFDEQLQFALGAEIFLHPSFKVRLGVNTRRFDLQTKVAESDFVAGVSAGFALEWQGILIESAMQSYGAAGWISQLSLSYRL